MTTNKRIVRSIYWKQNLSVMTPLPNKYCKNIIYYVEVMKILMFPVMRKRKNEETEVAFR